MKLDDTTTPAPGSPSGDGDGGGEVPEGTRRAAGRRRFSRRQLLAGSAGGIAALLVGGVAGYEWPHGTTPAAPPGGSPLAGPPLGVQRFVTRPDLQPPAVRVTTHRSASSVPAESGPRRYVFVSPRHDGNVASQQGLMICDRRGRLVWFHPTPYADPFDLNVQQFEGRPVLTWWQGAVNDGYGRGTGEMADTHYRHLRTIKAGDGLMADLHELNLTSRGTALITAFAQTTADLSAAGGARRGAVLAGHAQEIDLRTGKVLFDWSSLDHIGVGESYEPAPPSASSPYDYFHINSISETPDGQLLISAKNTWALYKVDRSSGAVLWRMNGKRSDFSMGKGANFYWQHDSRMLDSTRLTVFDDGSYPPEEARSRALLLAVDETARRVELTRAYVHPAGFLAANQGSVQVLPDGRVFVGWGNQPYFSEFAPDGSLLLDGQFPEDVRSYRAFSLEWNGLPDEAPRGAARTNPAGGTLVYASWNGATGVDSWQVLAGGRSDALRPVGSQQPSGFETAIAVNSFARYFQVVALDASNRPMGRSAVVQRDGAPG